MPDLLDKITSLFRPKQPTDPRISKLKELFLDSYRRDIGITPERFLGDIVGSELPGGDPVSDAQALNAYRDEMISRGPIRVFSQMTPDVQLLDPAKEYPYFNLAMASGIKRKPKGM